MTIRVQGPGGVSVDFPEGTDADTISRVMTQFMGGGQPQPPKEPAFNFDRPDAEIRTAMEAMPAKQRDATMAEWAKRRVVKEREGGGFGQTARDFGRNLVRGTPIGSWLDEGVAGVKAAMGGNYDEEVALERARNDAVDAGSTKLVTLPVVGDVTAGGLTKLAGGILSAPFSPVARVMQGATLAPQMVNYGLSGIGYGALYGAGEGTNEGERVAKAAGGAIIGGGLGAAAPAVILGAGNAYQYGAGLMRGMPQELQGFERGAVQRVARAFEADDAASLGLNERNARMQNIRAAATRDPRLQGEPQMLAQARVIQKTPNLGDDGMLVDYGNNLMRQGDTLVNRPGESAAIGRQALAARSDMRPARIARDVNTALGPQVADDIVADQAVRNANAAATPFYDQFRQLQIQPTNQLVDILQRVPGSAYNAAVEIASAQGVNLRTHRTNGLDGLMLDYIKRGVDQIAREAPRGSDKHRVYSDLARTLRDEVDNILVGQGHVAQDAAGQPIVRNGRPVSIWEQARNVSGEGKDVREAIQLGNRALDKNVSRAQLQAEMQGMTPPEVEGVRQGARNKIRTLQVTSTRDGQVVNPLQSYDSGAKMVDVIGDPYAAESMMRRFNAEAKMMQTENSILGGSPTAPRMQAQSEFPMPLQAGDPALTGMRQSSLTGIVAEATYRLANALTAGMLNERRSRVATDAARMLFAQGHSRDDIVRGLVAYGQQMGLTQQQRQLFERNVDRFIRGLRPVAIEAAVEKGGQ